MRNLIYQFVDEHSEGEAVDLFCVLLLAVVLDDLRGHEPLGAAETLGPGGQRRPADAVVGQLGEDGRTVRVLLGEGTWHLPDKHVFGLEVSVDDVLLVQVLQGSCDL